VFRDVRSSSERQETLGKLGEMQIPSAPPDRSLQSTTRGSCRQIEGCIVRERALVRTGKDATVFGVFGTSGFAGFAIVSRFISKRRAAAPVQALTLSGRQTFQLHSRSGGERNKALMSEYFFHQLNVIETNRCRQLSRSRFLVGATRIAAVAREVPPSRLPMHNLFDGAWQPP